MSGKVISYIRVNTYDQNGDRQLDGLTIDYSYTDKASCKDANRPECVTLLGYVRYGDAIKTHIMDRLAGNSNDLRKIVNIITQKGA